MTGTADPFGGGTWAVAWAQTEADGVPSPPVTALAAGLVWRWHGRAWRIERPWAPLVLTGAVGGAELRARAARVAQRLSGLTPRRAALPEPPAEPPPGGFLVTDGFRAWPALLLQRPGSAMPDVCFPEGLPPADTDLWIVRAAPGALAAGAAPRGGVICFTPGTRLATPDGARAIEDLRPGDRVLTADNGPQPVLWVGRRHVSGARLYAMPHLRPVRIRGGALGSGVPEGVLAVSPQHRVLVRGAVARALWNTPEVLVEAAHLIDDRAVTVDLSARSVTYVHVLFEAHQIVWANGVATESFHPAAAAEGSLSPADAEAIAALIGPPGGYGGFVRRPLSAAEAAILAQEGRRAA
jgi:hypothetical protein